MKVVKYLGHKDKMPVPDVIPESEKKMVTLKQVEKMGEEVRVKKFHEEKIIPKFRLTRRHFKGKRFADPFIELEDDEADRLVALDPRNFGLVEKNKKAAKPEPVADEQVEQDVEQCEQTEPAHEPKPAASKPKRRRKKAKTKRRKKTA